MGPNGAGKPTLYKILLDQEAPDERHVTRSREARGGFLPQEPAPAGKKTVIEVATDTEAHGYMDGRSRCLQKSAINKMFTVACAGGAPFFNA